MLLINEPRRIKLHTGVESIGLSSSRYTGSGTYAIPAGSNGRCGSLAIVIENVANCIEDNLAVECRSLVELRLVLWLEAVLAQCAALKSGTLIRMSKNQRKQN
jgi:hypothetical protein